MKINSNLSFQGKPGTRILNRAKKEFGGDSQRVNKYIKLYSDTFSNNLDENTIVDLSSDNKYIFSSKIFPGIEYLSDTILEIKNELLQSFLQECPKRLSEIEINMFRKIISTNIQQGKSIQDLKNAADKITNDKSKKHFLENLNIAECIITENPNSQLSSLEFDYTNMKLMEKEGNTPGTDLYNLIHSFDTKFEFE